MIRQISLVRPRRSQVPLYGILARFGGVAGLNVVGNSELGLDRGYVGDLDNRDRESSCRQMTSPGSATAAGRRDANKAIEQIAYAPEPHW